MIRSTRWSSLLQHTIRIVVAVGLLASSVIVTAWAPGSTADAASAPCRNTAVPTWKHVVWIVLENHNSSSIIGSSAAPYLNSVARSCAVTSNYHAVTHPSLPNYIAMTSGSTHGVTDDAGPGAHPLSGSSIFQQVSSRTIAETMPSNCSLTSKGSYAVKHNPQTYYTAGRTRCAATNVPMTGTPDLSAAFTFVVPNLCHDMHDCSVATGDAWLKIYLPRLFASPQYLSGDTAIFLTFDENEGPTGNKVATVVMAPSVKPGSVVADNFTHYSLLRTTESMLRVGYLGAAATASSMRPAFHL